MRSRIVRATRGRILLVLWALVMPAVFACTTLFSTPTPQPVVTVTRTPPGTWTPKAVNSSTPVGTPTLGPREAWRTSRIAFASNRTGAFQIYLMKPDGSGLNQLTDSAGDNRSPAWSDDAKHIYFVSTRDGNPEIYVMDSDGSNQKNITQDAHTDRLPLVLPAGKIAFVSDRKGRERIFVMNTDGTEIRAFANTSIDSTSQILCLTWLTEGRLFYSTDESGRRTTYVLDTSNGDKWIPEILAGQPDHSCPVVSQFRSSDWVLFVTNRDGHDELYGFREAINEDQSFTQGSEPSLGLSRSRDQNWVVFYSRQSGNWDIYVMNILGKDRWNITNDSADDLEPAWEPY